MGGYGGGFKRQLLSFDIEVIFYGQITWHSMLKTLFYTIHSFKILDIYVFSQTINWSYVPCGVVESFLLEHNKVVSKRGDISFIVSYLS